MVETVLSDAYNGTTLAENSTEETQTVLSDAYEGTTLAEKLRKYSKTGINRLFKECPNMPGEDSGLALMNLSETNDATTISLKSLYKKYWSDPTDITFVDAELGGRYDLWKRMCEHKQVGKEIEAWKEESRARFVAEQMKSIKELAEVSDPKTRMAALKFMCTTVLGSSESATGRGRPSKKEIQQKTAEMLQDDEDIKAAFARINAPLTASTVQ